MGAPRAQPCTQALVPAQGAEAWITASQPAEITSCRSVNFIAAMKFTEQDDVFECQELSFKFFKKLDVLSVDKKWNKFLTGMAQLHLQFEK